MPLVAIACCLLFAISAESAMDFDLPQALTLSNEQHRAAINRLWHEKMRECPDGGCPQHRHTRSVPFYDEPEFEEYPEEQNWMKRSQPVSPYISLGALSNLPAFFSELRGTVGALEQQRLDEAQQAQQAAAEADRAFRPPSTAAFLNAFRNYRPLRRTRSYPPALVHG